MQVKTLCLMAMHLMNARDRERRIAMARERANEGMNAWRRDEKKNIIESTSKNCNDHRNENYLQIKHNKNKNKAPTPTPPPTITATNQLQATAN